MLHEHLVRAEVSRQSELHFQRNLLVNTARIIHTLNVKLNYEVIH